MTIREMTSKDLAAAVDLCFQFIADTPYQREFGLTASRTTVTNTLESTLSSPTSIVLLAEQDGEFLGFILGMVTPWLLNDEEKVATELAWFVAPEARGGTVGVRLMQAFVEWSTELGAQLVTMSCIEEVSGEKVAGFYEKMGYSLLERAYSKAVVH